MSENIDHPRHRRGGLFPDDTYLSSTIVGMELVRQRREAYEAATPEERAAIDHSNRYWNALNGIMYLMILFCVGATIFAVALVAGSMVIGGLWSLLTILFRFLQ